MDRKYVNNIDLKEEFNNNRREAFYNEIKNRRDIPLLRSPSIEKSKVPSLIIIY